MRPPRPPPPAAGQHLIDLRAQPLGGRYSLRHGRRLLPQTCWSSREPTSDSFYTAAGTRPPQFCAEFRHRGSRGWRRLRRLVSKPEALEAELTKYAAAPFNPKALEAPTRNTPGPSPGVFRLC